MRKKNTCNKSVEALHRPAEHMVVLKNIGNNLGCSWLYDLNDINTVTYY